MKLKRLRQSIAATIFIFLTLAFLGLDFLPHRIYGALAHFQLIPGIVGILTGAGLMFAVSTVIILILTLLFGRVYCSHLCPMGIFQDLLAKVFFQKKQQKIHAWQGILAKIIFILVLIFSAIGSLWLLNILDPYSLFGKLFSTIFRPVFYMINNLIVNILHHFDNYSVSVLKYGLISGSLLFFSATMLVLFLGTSFYQKRFFCTTLCPAGQFLSLFTNHSLFKIHLNGDKCINCSACKRVCKTDCIDYKNNQIDNRACVTCFNCIDSCPTGAITFSRKKLTTKFQPARREWLQNSGLAATFLLPLLFRKKIKEKWTPSQPPVMPPGAKNIHHFTESCTACQLCITHCPTKVLKPAFFQYGLTGLFQPYLDFDFAYCQYECNTCTDICPSDALQPLNMETKKLTQLGTVELKTDLCVVYKNHTDCGACAEGCPTHAVYTEMTDNVNYPKTRLDICIGCGVCQNMCPVTPKAIIVHANEEQIIAKKPFHDENPRQPANSSDDDFPF